MLWLKDDEIYIELENPKEHGYPENSWFCIVGIPPAIEVYSSTHLYEIPNKCIALRLAYLSGQRYFIEQIEKEYGTIYVSSCLEKLQNIVKKWL